MKKVSFTPTPEEARTQMQRNLRGFVQTLMTAVTKEGKEYARRTGMDGWEACSFARGDAMRLLVLEWAMQTDIKNADEALAIWEGIVKTSDGAIQYERAVRRGH